MKKQSRLVDLKFKHIIHDTADAWLIAFDEDTQEWFPKSAVEVDEEDSIVTMREGLAIEKGVEGFAQHG